VHALPLAVAIAAALVLAPALRRTLVADGHTRPNYRGAQLAFPFGVLIVTAALLALIVLAPIDQLTDGDVFLGELGWIAPYALGVAFLGLADDALSGPSRGWRGHAAALRAGQFPTGALKAAGSLGLALFVLRGHDDYVLAVIVLVLATNLFNLLDLRPGRAVKAFVLLGAGLTIGAWDVDPLWALGLLAGPVLVAGAYDLRERVMLGDTGANLIGALAGLWLVLTLSTTGLAVAAAVLLVMTAYGELRSINALVERTPVLRHLDSIGRPHA
jgi:UDP-N-acetylmuramyl pentapeptide phosphotransferase/UDP-N-acetylglucosamine-1-phosphate transferase